MLKSIKTRWNVGWLNATVTAAEPYPTSLLDQCNVPSPKGTSQPWIFHSYGYLRAAFTRNRWILKNFFCLCCFPRWREGDERGSCCFLIRNFTTFEVLSPLCAQTIPYYSWSNTSPPQQNTVPGHLHSICLPPCLCQSEEVSPKC